MTTDDFAHVDLFVIAMIGFALGTGFFGAIISFDDPDKIPLAAWRVGDCKQRIYMEQRPKGCPLVEIPTPHGRLIDIRSVEDGKFVTVGNDYQRWWNGALESVIDNAPTVIEAEE